MATCEWCNQEMITADGCAWVVVEFPNGEALPSIRYGDEIRYARYQHEFSERCHDCNAKRGQYHHPGCDVEECPRCHGQLIGCGCLAEEDY